MTILIKDIENSSGILGETILCKTEEDFKNVYPGTLPFPKNANEPERYPVVVLETTTSESNSGRDHTHFVFFYDFEVIE